MKTLLPSLISVLVFSSCATQQKPIDLPPFNYEETKRAIRSGKNTVKGSGFLRQRGGGIVKISGEPVRLVPVTKYSTARILATYGNTSAGISRKTPNFAEDVPPAYLKLLHETVADVDGRFEFKNVADGWYYCITYCTWVVGENSNAGGAVMKLVNVRGGKTTNIVVSGR